MNKESEGISKDHVNEHLDDGASNEDLEDRVTDKHTSDNSLDEVTQNFLPPLCFPIKINI